MASPRCRYGHDHGTQSVTLIRDLRNAALAASSQTSAKSTPSSSALLTLSRTLVLGRTAVVVRITWGADVDAARLNSKWREHLSRSPAIWPTGRFAAGAGSPGCGSALFFTSPAPPAEPGGAGGSCG